MLSESVKNRLLKDWPALRANESLKNHCSYNIGGEAELFYTAKELTKLPDLMRAIKKADIPFFVTGKGTNILWPDEGFFGLVVKITADKIELQPDDILMAEAGVMTVPFIKKMGDLGFAGVEKDLTLPGTMGGLIRGNATRLGATMTDFLIKVEAYDTDTDALKTFLKDELEFSYRTSFFKKNPNYIVLRGYFRFPKATTEEIQKNRLEAIKISRKYPPEHNCGSFFKNPLPDKPSGWLIEQCGLKGFKVNDAMVSLDHANFLVNLGNAKAKDILELAGIIKEKVKEKFGIELEEEVMMVGNRL